MSIYFCAETVIRLFFFWLLTGDPFMSRMLWVLMLTSEKISQKESEIGYAQFSRGQHSNEKLFKSSAGKESVSSVQAVSLVAV